MPQWGIRRRRKRPERVKRSKQRAEVTAMPAAPTELAETGGSIPRQGIGGGPPNARPYSRAGQRSGITNFPRAGKNAAGKDKPGQQDGAGPTGAQPPAQDDAQVVGFGPDYAPAGPVGRMRRDRTATTGGKWMGWAGRSRGTGEAGRRPHRAISCRTVSGTGRGAGRRPAGLTWVGPIRREAPFLPRYSTRHFPGEALSGARRTEPRLLCGLLSATPKQKH